MAGMQSLRPRTAVRCHLKDPVDGSPLDDGLVLWFPGPDSYTGEDVVEFHVHGGRATVEAVSSVLARQSDIRLAEPGEFTRRAFAAGKMDLTEAEAVSDLVDAQTDAQRRQALRQLRGGLHRKLEGWRQAVVDVAARFEALIDFSEEDLPADTYAAAETRLRDLEFHVRMFLGDSRRGQRLRDGFQVTIVGAPNVGKSSLVNAIAERDAAIVSAAEGTTRDVIEVHLDLGGWPVTLTDTAGLRDTSEEVEQEGIRRALERAEESDLKLVVFDATTEPDRASVALLDDSALAVMNKVDLVAAEPWRICGRGVIPVSAKFGTGIPDLLDRIQERAAQTMTEEADAPLTRLRHREALSECAEALGRAGLATEVELVAEELRVAAHAIGRVTGRVDVEDILDVVFRDFCIGK